MMRRHPTKCLPAICILVLITALCYCYINYDPEDYNLIKSSSNSNNKNLSYNEEVDLLPKKQQPNLHDVWLTILRDNYIIPLKGEPRRSFEAEGFGAKLSRFFKSPKHGKFIEAGAADGYFLSNTIHLERKLEWSGLLIEPNTYQRPFILKSGRGRSRFVPTCLAIDPWPSVQALRSLPNNRSYHRDAIGGSSGLVKYIPSKNYPKIFIKNVTCFPLHLIMEAANLTTIDLLSLDIQGPELDVFKSINWSQVNIKSIFVEHEMQKDKEEFKSFLKNKGYKLHGATGNDYFFIHSKFQHEFHMNRPFN